MTEAFRREVGPVAHGSPRVAASPASSVSRSAADARSAASSGVHGGHKRVFDADLARVPWRSR